MDFKLFIILVSFCSIIVFLYLNLDYINIRLGRRIFSQKKEKYMEYRCTEADTCGGWGDRLKGILSTYAYAQIMDRKFLIQVTKNCDLADLLVPNEVNWDYKQINDLRDNMTITNMHRGWDYGRMERLKTENVFNTTSDSDLINVKWPIMYADSFSVNKYVADKLRKLGYEPSKFTVYNNLHKWYKELFKLNDNLEKKYEFYMKKLRPYKNSKIICAQVRMGDPGHSGQTEVDVPKRFWNFINSTFLNDTDRKEYTIFITGDREHFKKEAKEFFADNQVVYSENSSLHVESRLEKTNFSRECSATGEVLLDFHIMQNCDIGVISHSGFGLLAMWNRQEPFKDLYIYTRSNKTQMESDYWNRKNLTFIKAQTYEDILFY